MYFRHLQKASLKKTKDNHFKLTEQINLFNQFVWSCLCQFTKVQKPKRTNSHRSQQKRGYSARYIFFFCERSLVVVRQLLWLSEKKTCHKSWWMMVKNLNYELFYCHIVIHFPPVWQMKEYDFSKSGFTWHTFFFYIFFPFDLYLMEHCVHVWQVFVQSHAWLVTSTICVCKHLGFTTHAAVKYCMLVTERHDIYSLALHQILNRWSDRRGGMSENKAEILHMCSRFIYS